jgi:hypothetical protein
VDRSAFDEALMQAEFAVTADRDDAAGALAVLFVVDREAFDDLVDFGAAVFEFGAFGGQLFVPFDLHQVVDLGAACLTDCCKAAARRSPMSTSLGGPLFVGPRATPHNLPVAPHCNDFGKAVRGRGAPPPAYRATRDPSPSPLRSPHG